MLIGSSSYFSQSFPKPFDFGAAMVRTSLLAAGPAFELQFFLTQDAILTKLGEEIDNIHNAVNTKGATALIDLQISRLQNDLNGINDYKSRTDAKASRVEDTLANLIDLSTLADPASVAEFDTLLADTIFMMQKTKAPTYERYGVQDRLRGAKTEAIAQLQALVHNNFATQTDIDDTKAILTAIRTDYLASQSIINSNVKIAFTLQASGRKMLTELTRRVSNIKTAALSAATSKIKEKQQYYSQILTAISLSFEASQSFARFLAEAVNLPQEIEPGSVLNLFS